MWVLFPGLTQTSYVTSTESLHSSVPQFAHLPEACPNVRSIHLGFPKFFKTSGWDMQSVMITTMHLLCCCEQNNYLLADGEES